ncbi:MAG: RNA pseudouridine synthase [Phycisphaerae bacterium]|nr:RNA pseudouridine synthase [Phycisphaerae bacterium]
MTENRSANPSSEPRIVHRTDDWLVVNKPSGWHTVAQRGGDAQCIETWLRGNVPEVAACEEAGLVHRLDFGTSGCLVVALSAPVQQRLRQAFASADPMGIRKTYLALARSGLKTTGEFRLYFASRYKGSAKVTVRDKGERHERGECTWRVLGPSAIPGHERVEVHLIGPGRRHQIRAGLAYLGHPLFGDALYGSDGASAHAVDSQSTANPHSPALHAWRVVVGGVEVECESEAFATPSSPTLDS